MEVEALDHKVCRFDHHSLMVVVIKENTLPKRQHLSEITQLNISPRMALARINKTTLRTEVKFNWRHCKYVTIAHDYQATLKKEIKVELPGLKICLLWQNPAK